MGAIVAGLCATPVLAQQGPNKPFGWSIAGGGFYQSDTDLKDSPGSFSVSRGFLELGARRSWGPRRSVGISLGAGITDYSFDNATGLSSGDPWSTIEDYSVSVPIRFPVSQRANAILVPNVRWEAEQDADLGDGDSYGGFAGVAWRVNEGLTIGPGLGVFSRLEGGADFFPILIIDWSITDRLSLSTGGGLGASRGPGLTLTYQATKDWSLGIAARYEDNEFRLDDKGVAPDGIGRDRVTPVIATVGWEPNPAMSFSVFAGVELGGKLSLMDEDGNTIQSSDYDPAPIFGGAFRFRF